MLLEGEFRKNKVIEDAGSSDVSSGRIQNSEVRGHMQYDLIAMLTSSCPDACIKEGLLLGK